MEAGGGTGIGVAMPAMVDSDNKREQRTVAFVFIRYSMLTYDFMSSVMWQISLSVRVNILFDMQADW